ncbi:MAG TPA: hypothetical protein VGM88_06090 [Kofleriaceae bacterium]|jgi:hypothetical protein
MTQKQPKQPPTTEAAGQGQSGYSAGRNTGDPSQGQQPRNQEDPVADRARIDQGIGSDDRFYGRGGKADWGARHEPARAPARKEKP